MNTNLRIVLFTLITGVYMSAFTQELDRSIRPKPQSVPTVDLPDIQKAQLTNGLNVWLVEDHELPTVAMNLVINSGTDHDPVNMPGLASMTADVLDEGTVRRNALQIAEELDFIGAHLSVNATTDGTFMSLNTLTKHLDKALDVLADVLVSPSFPQKEFERLRQQLLTSLLQQKDRATTIATLSFNRIIYGDEHPYGLNSSGTEASLGAMTRENLVEFYKSYYRPNNATLIVVGDVKLKPLLSKLEPLIGSWKAGTVPANRLPDIPEMESRRLFLIDKPGAPQSEVRIGCPAVARSTPDFFAIHLMNRILGGQFASRLNMNLREKHGFTYGARSAFSFNKERGPFVAYAGVTATKTDSSVREFFFEIDLLRKKGVTASELDFVKKGFTGNFALNFETPEHIAGALQNLVLYSLPDNYYETYLQNINAVSLEQVNSAAAKYLDSSKMAVVVVGDLSMIREGLDRLGLGETILCDVNGTKVQ